MADRPLDRYLNDHLAGATFGRDLAERVASEARDASVRASMQQLATDIATDRGQLEHVMERVGAKQNAVVVAGGSASEKLSRVFTSLGSLDSEFGFFEALEALSLGVEGKRCLWTALRDVRDQYPGLSEIDLDALVTRAEQQRALLEEQRTAAVPRALGAVVGTAAVH
jgi:hypothetical protein